MADSYVCSGAMMKCTMGTSPARLTVLPSRTVFLAGQPQANISDHKSMVNLAPFGVCRSLAFPPTAAATAAAHGHLTPMPCVHNTPAPWFVGKMDTLIKGQPALLQSCKCQCMWGGTISLINNGQVAIGADGVDEKPKPTKWQQLCTSQQITDLSDYRSKQKEWMDAHIEEIAWEYRMNNGNKLDPDELRKSLTSIGYKGTNVPIFGELTKSLQQKVYADMLNCAVKNKKRSISILTGAPGSGKSTATNNLDLSQKGVVYDGAFNSFQSLEKAIAEAKEKGMTDIQVIVVYNDAITAFTNAIDRGLNTGRFLGLEYFVNSFRLNQGKIKKLQEKYPDVEIICYDNSGNQNRGRVSIDEAVQWNYSIDIQTLNQLLDIYENRINEGFFTVDQATSIGWNISKIEKRGTKNEWQGVKSRIDKIHDNLVYLRYVRMLRRHNE